MALIALAILLYLSCVRTGFDKTRSPSGRMALIAGRATMVSFGLFLSALLMKTGSSPYTVAVAGFGCMIAALYFPWIIADLIDGRTVKPGHGKPPEPKERVANSE